MLDREDGRESLARRGGPQVRDVEITQAEGVLKVLLDTVRGLPTLRAFDLFPMTHHVETIAILEPADVVH